MNNRMNRQLNTMKRLKQFGLDHPLPVANAAFLSLSDAIARIETLDSARLQGTGTFRSAAEVRQRRRKALRSALSDLSRVSKTLDRAAYPHIAAQLKMGRLNGNAEMLAFARSTITAITPIQSVFIAHGAPATVLEDLEALIAAFEASGDRRRSGLGLQINSNVALVEAIRAGMRQVRILDGIMHFVLKSDSGLMAEWIAAKRIERRVPAENRAAKPADTPDPAEQSSCTPARTPGDPVVPTSSALLPPHAQSD